MLLIFTTAFVITLTCLLNAEGAPPIVFMDQLIKPPEIIEHQKKPHAVFDYGVFKFLFVVSKKPTPFTQCNAVQ